MEKEKKPPNLRMAKLCSNCNSSMLLLSDHVCHCRKFDLVVNLGNLCDEWRQWNFRPKKEKKNGKSY